ncbi:hypothetical protein HDK64DRAFT_274844 [Phyllosticta capitalensis]
MAVNCRPWYMRILLRHIFPLFFHCVHSHSLRCRDSLSSPPSSQTFVYSRLRFSFCRTLFASACFRRQSKT